MRESVLQSLISVDMDDLPMVVKFLLHSISSTDAVEVKKKYFFYYVLSAVVEKEGSYTC